jgi:uncharacterized protein (DUF1501 family)
MDTSGILENMDAYYQMAFQLMHSEQAKKAFRIEDEPEVLRDKYGRTSLGQGSLLAARLIEAGARFVTVSSGNWDHHQNIFPALKNDFLPELDRAYSTLLEDLQQRGLLDSTLVIVSSEFGRTPEINHMAGRDHWPSCFSVLLAGSGITGGRVWGSSDEIRHVHPGQPGSGSRSHRVHLQKARDRSPEGVHEHTSEDQSGLPTMASRWNF